MKRVLFPGISMIVFFTLCAGQQEKNSPVREGPYLGQKPPGMSPEVFAPGIISSEKGVHSSPVFSPDGQYLFYCGFKNVFWVSAKILEKLRPKNMTFAPSSSPGSKKKI
jgi:hypothetical protein